MKKYMAVLLILCLSSGILLGERISKDPYIGAIVIDAAEGQVLFEDNADAEGYPASMLKLMTLVITLDNINKGSLSLDDQVRITAEASRMGGSQVYLAENEVFTVEELIYALMVQSANDAAVALAIQQAGSKEAFVALMNKKAAEWGMTSTTFQSVHGLPPGRNQLPDKTTARDFALLSRRILEEYPEALKYTSVVEREFRPDKPFMMRNHNPLLKDFDGCDGLKTGYFRDAGFSIAATAKRNDVRVIAVIIGSRNKQGRNKKARELLATGLMNAPRPKPTPAPTPEVSSPDEVLEEALVVSDSEAETPSENKSGGTWLILLLIIVIPICIGLLVALRRKKPSLYS